MTWVWCLLLVILFVGLTVLLCCGHVHEGNFTEFEVSLEPKKTVYFNASYGVPRFYLNSQLVLNPYSESKADVYDLDSSKYSLLLSRTRVIKSVTQILHGEFEITLTGYDNGGITLTNNSSKVQHLNLKVYGKDVYKRSNCLLSYFPMKIEKENNVYTFDDMGNMLIDDEGEQKIVKPQLVDNDNEFLESCYSYDNVKLCLSKNYTDVRLMREIGMEISS